MRFSSEGLNDDLEQRYQALRPRGTDAVLVNQLLAQAKLARAIDPNALRLKKSQAAEIDRELDMPLEEQE